MSDSLQREGLADIVILDVSNLNRKYVVPDLSFFVSFCHLYLSSWRRRAHWTRDFDAKRLGYRGWMTSISLAIRMFPFVYNFFNPLYRGIPFEHLSDIEQPQIHISSGQRKRGTLHIIDRIRSHMPYSLHSRSHSRHSHIQMCCPLRLIPGYHAITFNMQKIDVLSKRIREIQFALVPFHLRARCARRYWAIRASISPTITLH